MTGITPLEAQQLVAIRSQEHFDPGDPEGSGGIQTIAEELGLSTSDIEDANEWLIEAGIMHMPVSVLMLGTFIAGASWRAAQERDRPVADPPADDEATG